MNVVEAQTTQQCAPLPNMLMLMTNESYVHHTEQLSLPHYFYKTNISTEVSHHVRLKKFPIDEANL